MSSIHATGVELVALMGLLVEVRDLAGYFETYEGPVLALNGVDLELERGRVTGLVGETGSGKSTTASLMLGLSAANFKLVRGEILFDGIDILRLREPELRNIRGRRISIAFQDPRSALNPVIGQAVSARDEWWHGSAGDDRAGAHAGAPATDPR
jgi:ABC-type glutathione transport system ATPase component